MRKWPCIWTVNVFMILFGNIQANEKLCSYSYGFESVCKHIKDCPIVLNELIAKHNDYAYVQYIRDSNTKCGDVAFICCPSDGRVSLFDGKITGLRESSDRGRLLTPAEGCGYSNQNLRTRDGGKRFSKLGAFPWIALIGYTNTQNDKIEFMCGGTLITTKHILTAARCINSNLATVRLGEYNFTTYNTGFRDFTVIRSERHFNYNERDATNDIAILYLQQNVDISPHIRPVCLPISEPIKSQSFVKYRPFIVGWNLLQRNRKRLSVPIEQQIEVLDKEMCKERYRYIGKLVSENQFDKVLCAGFIQGHSNDCMSDIGSAMLQPIRYIDGNDFRYYQTGIASYGFDCQKSDAPAVYTGVQHFMDWIQEKIDN